MELQTKSAKPTRTQSCEKVISIISDKLNINVRNGDFDIIRRTGKFRSDGNRPIICKFVQRYLKHEVLKARRLLKGSSIVIREDLTRVNARLLENTSAHDQVKAAWSDEGKIVALPKNNKKLVVSRLSDLDKVSIGSSGTVIPSTDSK